MHSIPERIERQASACSAMGSPLYGALCLLAAQAYADETALSHLLDRHAARSRIAIRLLGAAHFRALRGYAPRIAAHFPSTGGAPEPARAWSAILDDIRANDAEYDELLARPVQTNEVGRATPILGALLTVAAAFGLPLRLFEIGSSAGLLLNLDSYRYSGPAWSGRSGFARSSTKQTSLRHRI